MVMHPQDICMLVDLHRQEMLDVASRERLAALAVEQSRHAGSQPKRLPNLVLVVATLIAVLLGLTAQHAASGAAQADTATATQGDGFVGAWRFTDRGFDLPSLATLTFDGNLLVSNPPVEPHAWQEIAWCRCVQASL